MMKKIAISQEQQQIRLQRDIGRIETFVPEESGEDVDVEPMDENELAEESETLDSTEPISEPEPEIEVDDEEPEVVSDTENPIQASIEEESGESDPERS